MKAVPLALASLLCLAPLVASAEWQWLDNDGHRVFSDHAPPADVAPNRILKQPGMRAATPPADVAAPVAATTAPTGVDPTLRPTGRDRALEERRRQVEAAEVEKKKAEEERVASLRADNCSRARTAKATLASGERISITNDKGERDFMDDGQRAAEARRMDGIIARDCRQDRQ